MIEVDLASVRTRYFETLTKALTFCNDVKPKSMTIEEGYSQKDGATVYVLTYSGSEGFDE